MNALRSLCGKAHEVINLLHERPCKFLLHYQGLAGEIKNKNEKSKAVQVMHCITILIFGKKLHSKDLPPNEKS